MLTMALKQWFSKPSADQLMADYALHGHPDTLAQLYDSLADDVYHYIASQTDSQHAQDVAQRAWIKVIDKRQLYRQQGNVKAWIFRIARNLMLDDFRANKKFVDELVSEPSIEPDYASQLADQLQFEDLMTALPASQREAFILQQEGFSLAEIATITEQPVETIKSRLRYARNRLKTALENTHD